MDTYALLIAATLNAGTVLAIASLGLLINEKAGIVNLGAEGMMLCAAIAGFVTVVATGLSRQNARRQSIQVVQGGLRTGTDNVAYQMPVTGMAGSVLGGAAGGGHADYGNMAVPSVWRTNRTQAAARVDALSSGGMDDLEIPAFLRKQAD